jgi:hypothetical protein
MVDNDKIDFTLAAYYFQPQLLFERFHEGRTGIDAVRVSRCSPI